MANQAYKGLAHAQIAEPIWCPTPISPVRSPVLKQQITTDYQHSHAAWNKLSSQMTDLAETNKLLKKAIKNAYKKVNSIPNPHPKKASNTTKAPMKVVKTVRFAGKLNKDSKDSNKTSKHNTVKANNKNNTTSNTVIQIQTSDSDQDTEIDKNDSESMGWNNLPHTLMTSDNSDMSDIDGTE